MFSSIIIKVHILTLYYKLIHR